MTRHFDSLEALAEYENAPKSCITSLRLTARSGVDSRFTVSFSSDDSRNVSVGIEAEEGIAVRLSQMVDHRLEAIRPWWSVLWKTDPAAVLFFLLFVAVAFLVVGALFGIIHIARKSSFDLGFSFSVGLVGAAALMGVGAVLAFGRARVFPIATFRIGQGEKRRKNAEVWRYVVVIAFGVSLLANLLSALMFR